MAITSITVGLVIKNIAGALYAYRKAIGITIGVVLVLIILLSAYLYWFGASDEPVVDSVKQEKVSKLNTIAIEATKTAEELAKREDVTDKEVRDAIKKAEDAQDDFEKAVNEKSEPTSYEAARKKYCDSHPQEKGC